MVNLFYPKCTEFLTLLYNLPEKQCYSLNIGRELRSSPTVVQNFIRMFKEENIVVAEKRGNKKILMLTDKGKEVAFHILRIKSILKN